MVKIQKNFTLASKIPQQILKIIFTFDPKPSETIRNKILLYKTHNETVPTTIETLQKILSKFSFKLMK